MHMFCLNLHIQACPAGFHWCEKDHKCVHPFEVCQATSLSLCNLNTTEPPINCSMHCVFLIQLYK